MLSSCVPWPLLRVVWILFMPGISDWDCRICFGLQVQHLVTWYVLSWKITLTSSTSGWKQGGTGVQVEATPCHPSGDMSRRFDIHFNIPMNAYHDGRIVPWDQPLDSEGKQQAATTQTSNVKRFSGNKQTYFLSFIPWLNYLLNLNELHFWQKLPDV